MTNMRRELLFVTVVLPCMLAGMITKIFNTGVKVLSIGSKEPLSATDLIQKGIKLATIIQEESSKDPKSTRKHIEI